MADKPASIATSIAPWFTIDHAASAVEFYKSAFKAAETYRLEMDGGLVVSLSVDGAIFWVSGNNTTGAGVVAAVDDREAIRMILTVDDPDTVFAEALQAGAREVFPVS